MMNVHFKCYRILYVQSGLIMGDSMAVLLANVWIKSFEASLQSSELSEISMIKMELKILQPENDFKRKMSRL